MLLSRWHYSGLQQLWHKHRLPCHVRVVRHDPVVCQRKVLQAKYLHRMYKGMPYTLPNQNVPRHVLLWPDCRYLLIQPENFRIGNCLVIYSLNQAIGASYHIVLYIPHVWGHHLRYSDFIARRGAHTLSTCLSSSSPRTSP